MKILLLGSNDRAGLTTARMLGRDGHKIDVVYFANKTPMNFSKFVKNNVFIGDPFKNVVFFKDALFKLVEDKKYQAVIPMNDIAVDILFSVKHVLQNITTLVIPNELAYRTARNKLSTMELAKELGIPVPQYEVLQSLAIPPLEKSMYAKPFFSSTITDDVCYTFKVKKVRDWDTLENFLREVIDICPVMLQKEVKGIGIGVNVFCSEGKILAYTVNKRIHEPIDGGGSSYRVSEILNIKLRRYVEKLTDKLQLSGAMMFEFKATENDFYLMEINPRLWGSLPLSVFSRIPFPQLMIGTISGDSTMYKTGMYARHLLKDLKWIAVQLIRSKNPLILLKWIASFRRLFTFKERFDVEAISDIRPGLSQLYFIVSRYTTKVKRRIQYHRLKMTSKSPFPSIETSTSFTFVCKGNINRSAFAEHFLHGHYPQLRCSSSGTLLLRNRMTTKESLTAAKSFGVQLESHRSKSVYDINFDKVDIVFVFDYHNFLYMKDYFPGLIGKIRLLGEDANEIADPNGKSVEHYKQCYKAIIESIESHFGEAH